MVTSILKSRQLWTFVAAQVVLIATLVAGHYVTDPFALDMAKYFIGLTEGVAGIMITAFTVEDTVVRTRARIEGIIQGTNWRNLIK